MARIKLESVEFGEVPFRKLRNMRIPIAQRLTLIAGHNGLGKSTILGLAANGSGITQASYRSYFDRTYQGNLYEIIFIDFEGEYEARRRAGQPLPNPTLRYMVGEHPLAKKCTLTPRKQRGEIRVVPRNDPHVPFEFDGGTVGTDGKVPLPTLFLGMSRMLPIGESDPEWVSSSSEASFHPDDAKVIRDFIDGVIPRPVRGGPGTPSITTQSIRGTKKTAKHPDYPYSSKAISLGQDSLSAIATAVASFAKLKREWKGYSGGLLVIDELDAGLHPHAQTQLAQALKKAARDYDLQVVATTHSMHLIECVHPDLHPIGTPGQRVDGVVYLHDTAHPVARADLSIEAIRRDMRLDPPTFGKRKVTPSLKAYLEDPEAHFVFRKLLTPALRERLKKEVGVLMKPIPLSVGCDNLKGFLKHDPYFKSVVIVLDADARPKTGDAKNIVRLPGGSSKSGTRFNPERTIYSFIEALAANDPDVEEICDALREQGVTSDQLRAHLLDTMVDISKREPAKKWFRSKQAIIDNWGLYELWFQKHPAAVKAFADELIAASRVAFEVKR